MAERRWSLRLPGRHVKWAFAVAWAIIEPPASMAIDRDIRNDTDWRGTVLISTDVAITSATVRVEPGTIIQFVKPVEEGSGPVILLNSPVRLAGQSGIPGRLLLEGSPDRPIVVETLEGRPPGSIIAGPGTTGSFFARHVIFRRLGTPMGSRLADAGVQIELEGRHDDVWITDCRFENCGPVRVVLKGTSASMEMSRCTFANGLGNLALSCSGTSQGHKVITNNVSDTGFRIESGQTLVRDNVLVGPSAGVSVPVSGISGVAILDNYIHCTTKEEWGRPSLKCDTCFAALDGNVLVGGTCVVEAAPNTVTGNVFVGSSGLTLSGARSSGSPRNIDATDGMMTRYLLTNQGPAATIRDNLFLGPAWAAIATGRHTAGVQITNNLFDGWGMASRAVEFHAFPRQAADAILARNIFVRYQMAPVTDRAGRPETLGRAGDNIFCEVPLPAYQGFAGVGVSPAGDRQFDSLDHLGLAPVSPERLITELEEPLLKREIGVAGVRSRWFAAYRLRGDSPLRSADPRNRVGPSGIYDEPAVSTASSPAVPGMRP